MRPKIILTLKFVLPQAKVFQKYVDYLTRQQALENKVTLSPSEQSELTRIKSVRDKIIKLTRH